MRSILFSAIFFMLILASSCSNGTSKNEHEGHEAARATEATTQPAADKEVKVLEASYHDVDPAAAASLKRIFDQYLATKDALSSDKPADAEAAAKSLVEAAGKLDKSLLTAEQKKTFDGIVGGIKDHASEIAKSADIKVQREHFDELSNSVYELAKAFGAGRPLYHAHCPMANNDQGAMWINENKEIKNPYFGSAMLNCGTVEEEIR